MFKLIILIYKLTLNKITKCCKIKEILYCSFMKPNAFRILTNSTLLLNIYCKPKIAHGFRTGK